MVSSRKFQLRPSSKLDPGSCPVHIRTLYGRFMLLVVHALGTRGWPVAVGARAARCPPGPFALLAAHRHGRGPLAGPLRCLQALGSLASLLSR